ncbi:BlaI/MecI/CopY family transcriptional regulator [Vallitalea pronyensis]|uniref:BlaI/MecI/CopY family transcriptional regulator n=1 Tax=Vallitalea pronyensis TaxID=1348613 RepID=A0A8J8MJ66_9FIRM|nr:BlaI/MecI/CopY family transcriptional regulator [Vallitalea pronyensis]QUI22625.1 BlaI/MecI/CopY family transcriptional regulator [Vallitalea pronyensis]
METIKLYDSELRLMEIIWTLEDDKTAKHISLLAADAFGWNKNTTYTVLKKLVAKGAIERVEPQFQCMSKITREQVQLQETRLLIDKLYNGSLKAFFTSFIKKENLTDEEMDELKKIIDDELE